MSSSHVLGPVEVTWADTALLLEIHSQAEKTDLTQAISGAAGTLEEGKGAQPGPTDQGGISRGGGLWLLG